MSNENTMLTIKAFEVTQHELSEIDTENLISRFDSVGEQTQLLQGKIKAVESNCISIRRM